MPTAFPAALDNLTNPAADDPRTGHAAQHADVNDAVEAIESAIGTMSSPALARLAGIAGGQTLIGGTGATDKLTLQATSASGTTGTNKAITVKTGDAGVTEAVTVLHSGAIGIGVTNPDYPLTVGSGTYAINVSAVGLGIGQAPGSFDGYMGARVCPVSVSHILTGITSTETIGARIEANPSIASSATYRGMNAFALSTSGNTNNIFGSIRGLQADAHHKGTGTVAFLMSMFGYTQNVSTGTVTQMSALQGQSYNMSTGTVTANYGASILASNQAAGVIGTNYAFEGVARNNSSGTITTNVGISAIARKGGTGSITTNVGLQVYCGNLSATGSITTNTGLEIGGANSPWVNSGTVTTNTALLIGNSTNFGTTKKAFDCQSTADSSFAGKLGIGNSAPTANLDVMATTEQLRLGYDAIYYAAFTVGSTGALKIAAPLSWRPAESATPAANGDLTIEATSNTQATIKFKGTDGVVRSVALTLS